jgi:AcrR family transcriptional regulator
VNPRQRSGRRPGKPQTRGAILEAARQLFAEHGFDKTTMRAIAAGAGVDPALVHHYFGTKRDLFIAVIDPPEDPARVLAGLAGESRERFGEALVLAVLQTWDSAAQPGLVALVRSAVAGGYGGTMVRQLIDHAIAPVLRRHGVAEEQLPRRLALIESQMLGMLMMRYVLALPAFTSIDAHHLARLIGPTIQRYLDDDLPGPEPTPRST